MSTVLPLRLKMDGQERDGVSVEVTAVDMSRDDDGHALEQALHQASPPPATTADEQASPPPATTADEQISSPPLRPEQSEPPRERSSSPRRPDETMCRILRHTPIPTMVLDPTLRVLEVSDSHLALTNRKRDEVVHASIYEIPPRTIPAPDITSISGALQAAITTRAVQSVDNVYVAETGLYYRLQISPIYEETELVAVVLETHDATKDRPDEKPITEQVYLNETYKILVDTVKDYAIYMLDARGHIATWNSGASILKGYSTAEIIGKHFSIFYGEEDRLADKPGKELAICLREGKVEDEGWRYRKDGSRFWANVMITPIFQLGRHVGFVKVTRDLTERKAAEARLIAAFEESSKLKSDFLANMSHEIRTPMNGMYLALTMLTDTALTEQQREYASIIEDSTNLLLQVINDVLDYSKLSSGSFSLTADVVSIETVIGAVVRNCKSSTKPGVVIESQLPDDLPQHVKGDPLRFRQVLQNLVGNAVKFTEQGSVRIRTSFEVDPDELDMWQITTEVIDTGIGVREDAINTLFTPFTRFADSTTKRYQGTGLGLSICKSLAELMGGSVGFRPNPEGQGSIFWLTVRMGRLDVPWSDKVAARSRSAARAPDPNEAIRKLATQKQILLVEDNMVNQTVMIKLLNTLGFERVDTAWDGAEAVRMVKQKPLSYNVVLMDINMPVLDGLEATTQIRAMKVDVPIIALTGNALEGDAETYLAKGMNDYLAKPVHRQQLVRILLKWLG